MNKIARDRFDFAKEEMQQQSQMPDLSDQEGDDQDSRRQNLCRVNSLTVKKIPMSLKSLSLLPNSPNRAKSLMKSLTPMLLILKPTRETTEESDSDDSDEQSDL